MVNLKILTAAVAFASLGIAAPVTMAEDATPASTIHEDSAGTGVSEAADPNGEDRMDVPTEAGKEITGPDAPVHNSAYKKTYPDEKDVGEVEE